MIPIKVDAGPSEKAQERAYSLGRLYERQMFLFKELIARTREITSATFRDAGREQRWQPWHSKRYAWFKKANGLKGGGLLVFSGALRQSLEYDGAPGSYTEIHDRFAIYGTRIPYAMIHQTGGSIDHFFLDGKPMLIPKRKFLGNFTKEDKRQLQQTIPMQWAIGIAKKIYGSGKGGSK